MKRQVSVTGLQWNTYHYYAEYSRGEHRGVEK